MKKTILSIVVASSLLASSLFGQNETYKHAFGVHFGTIQYNGDLSNQYFDFDQAKPALGLSYSHYLNKALDATLGFTHGRIQYQNGPLNPAFKTNLYNFDLMLRYKLNNGYFLREDFPVAPFFHFGVSDAISTSDTYPQGSNSFDFNFPLGGGIVISPATRFSAVIQTTHHWTLTDSYDGWEAKVTKPNNDNFLVTTIGIKYNFNTIEDADGDGIADDKDLCPDVKGVESANGCPDADGDGVADNMDKCPNLAGIEANKGCPKITRSDLKVLNMAMSGLYFKTGSAVIKEESFGVLNNVIDVMKRHPEYNLLIEGHTDNTGSADGNLQLSKERAAAAKTYLVTNGLEDGKITSNGYGQENPVADNSTEEGRAKNRRVSFRVVF